MWYRDPTSVRFILVCVGFTGAILAPPWVPLLAMLALSVRFAAWEILALGLFVDLLWFTPSGTEGLSHALPLFTLAGVALLWGFGPLRREFLTR